MRRRKLWNLKLAVTGAVFLLFSVASLSLWPGPARLFLPMLPDVVWAGVPPLITVISPAEGQWLNAAEVTVTGTTEPNAAVEVYIDGSLWGSVRADTAGGWVFVTPSLADGAHSLWAVATDIAGNTSTSGAVNFTVDTSAPAVTITAPLDGSYTNKQTIEGWTEPGLPVVVCVYGREGTVTADATGFWSYTDPLLPEGNHTVYVTATDRAGNRQTSPTHSFILDMTRPRVLPEIFPAQDMTQVPIYTAAKVYLVEKSPLDPAAFGQALRLTETDNPLAGAVHGSVYSSVYTDVYGNPCYEVVFQPDLPLKPATKYTASVDPGLADAAGNRVYPRSWSFTTVSGAVYETPHGCYLANTNVCVNCHTPHRGWAPKLVTPRYVPFVQIDDYCLACHDGTVAPVPSDWAAPRRHDYKVTIEGTTGPSACTSCHNPHLPWSPENPNLLQDYYFYEHNDPTNPFLPDSSEEAMCNLCHDPGIIEDPGVQYVNYGYNKWHTASGTPEDYSLCLRCHDGGNASDIKTFYTAPSGHARRAVDGSYLDGPFACADCHNTHGAANLKLLKSSLGHNSAQGFATTGTAWDAVTERAFCRACHNNVTELYGIVARFVYTVPGHEDSSTEYCHKCHGGTPVKAAHAPDLPG